MYQKNNYEIFYDFKKALKNIVLYELVFILQHSLTSLTLLLLSFTTFSVSDNKILQALDILITIFRPYNSFLLTLLKLFKHPKKALKNLVFF